MLSDNNLQELLIGARTIAVVGLSDRPDRPSYAVARFLQRNGYRVLPVNPHLSGPVLGMQPYATLSDIGEPVDIVTMFRRAEHAVAIAEESIAIGARVLWMQVGIINQQAAQLAHAAGLQVVMDRCMAIEHRRLMRYAMMAH